MKLFSFINNTEGTRKYFKNTAWLVSEKVIRILSTILVGVWVVRYLGPSNYGILTYAQSFVAIFAVLSNLGLESIVVRDLVRDTNNFGKIIGTVFWLKFFGAFGVLAILTLAVSFTSNDYPTNMVILIIGSSTLFQSFNVIDLYFQSKVLNKYVAYSNLTTLLISSFLKIALISFNAPLLSFAYVILFDSLILSVFLVYFFLNHSKFRFSDLKFKIEIAISLLKESWPLLMNGFVVIIYMRIDQVMVKEILNSDAVGQYGAAVKLSEAFYFIPAAIVSSVFPAIVNAKKISEKFYYDRLQMLYDILILVAIALAIPMTFFSDWLINILFGNQYNHASGVLMIHVWASIFIFTGIASGKWFVVENLQKYVMINSMIGAIMNIGINLYLIPKIGIKGAAWATLISYFFASYILLYFHKKTRSNFFALSKSLILSSFIKIIKNKKTNYSQF